MKNTNKVLEIWKDVIGYEGLYQVSNLGRVKSLERIVFRKSKNNTKIAQKIKECIKKGSPDKDGYLKTNLWANGKYESLFIHRIVAICFIENHFNLPQVNHKDEEKNNNIVSNLEWITCIDNIRYGEGIEKSRASRSMAVIQTTMSGKFIMEYPSISDTKKHGFCFQGVHMCCSGKRKHYKKYIWIFKSEWSKENGYSLSRLSND